MLHIRSNGIETINSRNANTIPLVTSHISSNSSIVRMGLIRHYWKMEVHCFTRNNCNIYCPAVWSIASNHSVDRRIRCSSSVCLTLIHVVNCAQTSQIECHQRNNRIAFSNKVFQTTLVNSVKTFRRKCNGNEI